VFCNIASMLERMAQEQPAIWNYVTEYGQFTDAGADHDVDIEECRAA